MSKEIAFITLHGMGDIKPHYAEEIEEKLSNKVGASVWEDKVHLEAIQYQKHFQHNENKVWQRMNAFPLDGGWLRRFLLFGFGDAGSLEHSGHRDQVVYKKVQQEIASALDNAFDKLGSQSKPVIIIAQSLGCQVISNYIWDAQNNLGIFESPADNIPEEKLNFRKLASCEYLVTTGCNIPLFVSGLDNIQCFKKPNPNFTWHNFYDKDDVLGWPLSPLSESFRNCVDLDQQINAGGVFSSWQPFSHGQYWGDKSVLKHIVRRLKLSLNI